MTRIEERTATLRSGLTLPYAEAGQPGSSVPVVLVHAYVETWRYFAPLLRALPPTLHVFAPTLRGHPSVVGEVSGFGIDDAMADVADFLDALGLRRAVLVGASSGGLLCQRLAVQRPDRVVGLVLVSSPVTLADKPGVLAMSEEIGALTDPVDRGFVERFVSDTSPSSMAREQVEALVDETLAIPARVWREAFRGLLEAAPASLEELDAPTLLLAGGDDGIVGTDQQLLVSRIAKVELVEYAGIGHAPHLAHPDLVAADLVRFVQRLPSA